MVRNCPHVNEHSDIRSMNRLRPPADLTPSEGTVRPHVCVLHRSSAALLGWVWRQPTYGALTSDRRLQSRARGRYACEFEGRIVTPGQINYGLAGLPMLHGLRS